MDTKYVQNQQEEEKIHYIDQDNMIQKGEVNEENARNFYQHEFQNQENNCQLENKTNFFHIDTSPINDEYNSNFYIEKN